MHKHIKLTTCRFVLYVYVCEITIEESMMGEAEGDERDRKREKDRVRQRKIDGIEKKNKQK